MRLRSFLVLGLAVLMGLVSVLFARQWLERSAPIVTAEAQAPAVPMSTVVVARVPLTFGNQLSPETLRVVPWPQDAKPPGTFSTLEELFGAEGDDQRVVLRPIEANEPVLASRISGFGGRASLSAVIAEDMRAMTIRVNDVHGVAGFVLPGDRVDVLLTREIDRHTPLSDILLQNIQVLGVDQDANEKRDRPQVARAVTLEVTPEQAQKLTLAQTVGTLSLSLRNHLNILAVTPRTITLRDLGIPDIAPQTATAEAAADPAPPPAVRRDPGVQVRVVRGLSSSNQRVMPERATALIPGS